MDSLSNYPRPYIDADKKKSKSKRPSATSQVKASKAKFKLHIRPSYAAVIILLIVAVFFFVQYQDAKNKLNPTTAVAKTDSQLVTKLSKIYLLPKNETPLFRTVNDASKLTSQSYFANAKDGDKLIVYAKQHLAILYRPSTNQIINVGSASVGSTNATSK